MNYSSKEAGLAIKMIERHAEHDCAERTLYVRILTTTIKDAVSRSFRLREEARRYFVTGTYQAHADAAGLEAAFFRDIVSRVVDYADDIPVDGKIHDAPPMRLEPKAKTSRPRGRPRNPVQVRFKRPVGRPPKAVVQAAA